MPWDRSAPTDPKYRTPEHRNRRAALVRQLKRDGYLTCVAINCEMGDRTITNPRGDQHDGLTLGHNDDGITYRGPEHRACNLRDGAKRGNARSRGHTEPKRWPL